MTTVRAARVQDAPAMGRVHVRAWQAAYRGQMPDEYLDGLRAEQRAEYWTGVLERGPGQTTVLVAEEPPPDVFALPGVRELRRDGALVRVEARDGIDGVVKAMARHQVVDLRTEQPSLEDVFLAYYAGGEAAQPVRETAHV